MIPDAVIDEIRERVDIVAVIGRHMELKKSGRTWKGCCVFHGERTPSFHVYPEDRHFKCYGCGEYGDVFKFLQKVQGKEFPEIVRALALEVGVAIPEREEDSAEQRRRRQERAEILAACDVAARYFSARLASKWGEEARAYLAGRGFQAEILERFRLGVASTAWDDLSARLEQKGVSQDALEKAGLVVRRDEGSRYDRFRGRLMIPIAAMDGEVIGFGGRVLPGAKENLAKYINSPETAVYKKSKVLYGVDLAREHIRRTRSAVLVEGYFDVIGLHQAGVKNAVAVCGTALTPEHVDLLRRLDCRTLTLLFDGDAAGVAAATKAAAALLPSGIMGRVALLPREGGKTDPDEYARTQGAEAVEKLIAGAAALTEYLIDRALAEHCGPNPRDASFEQRMRAYGQLKPLLETMPPGLARQTFEDRVVRRIDLSPDAVARDLGTEPPAATGHPEVRRARTSMLSSAAVDALGMLVAFPALAEVAREEHFLTIFEGEPLEHAARAIVDQGRDAAGAAELLAPLLPTVALKRFQDLSGQARPDPEAAEREFRKATVAAKLEIVQQEIDRLSVEASRGPLSEELRTAMLKAMARLGDLKKRADGRRPG